MPLRPTIAVVATEAEERLRAQRRGYWLRLARIRAGNPTLQEVAKALGYSLRSQGTISQWESGRREPAIRQLERLAALYDVPVEIFVDPDETDMDRLERRIADIRARHRRSEVRSA